MRTTASSEQWRQWLRTMRAELGWRQEDLAVAAGVHRDTIRNIERGQLTTPPTRLKVRNAIQREVKSRRAALKELGNGSQG